MIGILRSKVHQNGFKALMLVLVTFMAFSGLTPIVLYFFNQKVGVPLRVNGLDIHEQEFLVVKHGFEQLYQEIESIVSADKKPELLAWYGLTGSSEQDALRNLTRELLLASIANKCDWTASQKGISLLLKQPGFAQSVLGMRLPPSLIDERTGLINVKAYADYVQLLSKNPYTGITKVFFATRSDRKVGEYIVDSCLKYATPSAQWQEKHESLISYAVRVYSITRYKGFEKGAEESERDYFKRVMDSLQELRNTGKLNEKKGIQSKITLDPESADLATIASEKKIPVERMLLMTAVGMRQVVFYENEILLITVDSSKMSPDKEINAAKVRATILSSNERFLSAANIAALSSRAKIEKR